MQTIDHQVLQTLDSWLLAGKSCWLCTIVRAVGSSPRPVGSLLACTADGEQVGSLSGGCVEDDLLERVRAGELALARPQIIEYGVTPEENERLGLPCGGRLEVLIESLQPGSAKCEDIAELAGAMAQRRCVLRYLDLASGASRLEPVANFVPLSRSEQQVVQCFGPRMRILLVGAGQLAQSLSELALAMDYEVQVTDPRARMLEQWTGPAVTLLGGMPDDVIREQGMDSHSVIITLTHDPRIDDMALMEALTTQAWYVGALGSSRTTEKRLQRLRELELEEAQIARLHAPVGLDIGSKTPLEIAVSIMAQITALRRRG
jgi:xanthine dehydrogenase accessory factor